MWKVRIHYAVLRQPPKAGVHVLVIGTHAYSKKECWQGEELSTQQLLLRLIEKQPDYPLERLVTHEFALEDYKEATISNVQRGKYQSVKTLFRM